MVGVREHGCPPDRVVPKFAKPSQSRASSKLQIACSRWTLCSSWLGWLDRYFMSYGTSTLRHLTRERTNMFVRQLLQA